MRGVLSQPEAPVLPRHSKASYALVVPVLFQTQSRIVGFGTKLLTLCPVRIFH